MPSRQFVAHCARIVSCSVNDDEAVQELLEALYEDVHYHSPNGLSFNDCKRSAIDREIPFNLTFREHLDIIKGNCTYCGKVPYWDCGVDRVDPKIGYVFTNCVPCCALCNYIKSDSTYEDFILRCEKIASNFMMDEIDLPEALRPDRKIFMFDKILNNISS